ncbi:hypothetical protein ACWGTO_29810, partial [Mesorhizobium sp. PL10]
PRHQILIQIVARFSSELSRHIRSYNREKARLTHLSYTAISSDAETTPISGSCEMDFARPNSPECI